jgi:hypothetical protein
MHLEVGDAHLTRTRPPDVPAVFFVGGFTAISFQETGRCPVEESHDQGVSGFEPEGRGGELIEPLRFGRCWTISIRQIALGGISWVSWSSGKTLKAISKGCREPELLPRVQVIPKGFELFQLSFQGIE